jgi:hypothetical protein
MQFVYESTRMWLVREDNWRYPLDGIVAIDIEHDWSTWGSGHVMTATVINVSDTTLDSIRVLRDEMPDHFTLRIESSL